MAGRSQVPLVHEAFSVGTCSRAELFEGFTFHSYTAFCHSSLSQTVQFPVPDVRSTFVTRSLPVNAPGAGTTQKPTKPTT